MAAGDAYITCLNNEAGAEALLRMISVDSDGNLYIDCDNTDTSILDLINLLIVEDASGNPALSVALTGGASTQHHEFTAVALQVAFDTTPFFDIDANYKVYVNGAFQSWGHSRVGNVVTFVAPFAGGEEVSIHQ